MTTRRQAAQSAAPAPTADAPYRHDPNAKQVALPPHDGKADQGKLRFSLFPIEALNPILEVLEFGATKYSEGGWTTVPDAERRYCDALHRHYVEHLSGVDIDEDSGKPVLALVATNAIFLLAFRMRRLAGVPLTERRST